MKNKYFSQFVFGYVLLFLFTGCYSFTPSSTPFEQVSKDKPLYYDLIAQQYYNNESYEKSIFVYKKLLSKFTGQKRYNKILSWTEYEIGFCYYLLADYEKAKIYFKSVVENYDNIAAATLSRDRLRRIDALLR